LDRTVTRGGRLAFARRITTPLGSAKEIAEVQAALRFLRAHPETERDLPRSGEVEAVSRYMESRFATLSRLRWPGRWWEAAWIQLRYPELQAHALQGTGMVRSFLPRIARLRDVLRDGPPVLSGLGDELGKVLATEPFRGLLSGRGIPGAWDGVLRLDQRIRDDGRDGIRGILGVIYELDALLSMTMVTAELGFSFPRVDEEEEVLRVEGLYHPFVRDAVPNDLVMRPGHRVLFLTGPNMAGKSTWLKACGVALLLAHCGMGVPAREARMGFVSRLISAIRTEDSVWEGVSYFQSEARRVKAILDAVSADGSCFVVADEIFRGTNVNDAIDATRAVLRGLALADGGRFVVASHLSEAVHELRGREGFLFLHFQASSSGGDLRFDYSLQPGVSDQRLGMEVLRKEGVLDALRAFESWRSRPAPSPGDQREDGD
jgi:DNA mismatch repair protein MutS